MLHTSKRIGCVGFNVNVANALAAVFTATGQDIACIAESATAHLTIEPWSHDDMSGRTEGMCISFYKIFCTFSWKRCLCKSGIT